jgi:hypothetical protein
MSSLFTDDHECLKSSSSSHSQLMPSLFTDNYERLKCSHLSRSQLVSSSFIGCSQTTKHRVSCLGRKLCYRRCLRHCRRPCLPITAVLREQQYLAILRDLRRVRSLSRRQRLRQLPEVRGYSNFFLRHWRRDTQHDDIQHNDTQYNNKNTTYRIMAFEV